MSDAMVRADGAAMVVGSAHALETAMRAASALKGARGLLPESLRTEGEVLAVILAGQELGLPTMASLRGLQVVRGKVIISYDTMIALLKSRGYRVEWLERTAERATLRLTDPQGVPHVETWDVDRAKRAGLWGQKGPWSQYPETMLGARAVSSAARAFAGEVLSGCYVEGEIPASPAWAPAEPERVSVYLDPQDAAPDPGGEDPLADAMSALDACRTDGALREWVAAFGERLEREPQTDRKVARWKRVVKVGGTLTPPVRTAEIKQLFVEARTARQAPAWRVALDAVTDAASLRGWGEEHAEALRSESGGQEVWQAAEKVARALGCLEVVDELEVRLSEAAE